MAIVMLRLSNFLSVVIAVVGFLVLNYWSFFNFLIKVKRLKYYFFITLLVGMK